jgi:hypothetical protein
MKIKITKRVYIWLAIVLLILASAVVFAYGSGDPNANGHPASQIDGLQAAINSAMQSSGLYPVTLPVNCGTGFVTETRLSGNQISLICKDIN